MNANHHHEIVGKNGTELIGKNGESLFLTFLERTKAFGGRAHWGDRYTTKAIKKDADNVVMKCRKTGEQLILIKGE